VAVSGLLLLSALREFCGRRGSSASGGLAAQYPLALGKTGPLLWPPEGFVLTATSASLRGKARAELRMWVESPAGAILGGDHAPPLFSCAHHTVGRLPFRFLRASKSGDRSE
jgi:hypothetical protein